MTLGEGFPFSQGQFLEKDSTTSIQKLMVLVNWGKESSELKGGIR